MLTAGSCATRTYEPCQVRKEAAISKHLRVPWECLVRANCLGNVRKVQFGNKRMTFILPKMKAGFVRNLSQGQPFSVARFYCKRLFFSFFLFLLLMGSKRHHVVCFRFARLTPELVGRKAIVAPHRCFVPNLL